MTHFQIGPAREQQPSESAPFHQWPGPDDGAWAQFFKRGSGYLARLPGLADFTISGDGQRVHCHPAPGTTDGTVEHLYLNQVLPLALSRQGRLVLHASGLDLGGSAVAFVGQSGRGKSTLAASFASAGYPFLCDDALVIDTAQNGLAALPGHPSIRLWEDSQCAVLGDGVHKSAPVQYTSKGRFLAGTSVEHCYQPRPLSRIYFLGSGTAQQTTVDRIRASDALIELSKHAFLLDPETRRLISSHFEQLAALARLGNCFRLDYPRRFDRLAEVREAILRHVVGSQDHTIPLAQAG